MDKFFIIRKQEADFESFVEFWSQQYNNTKPLEWAFDTFQLSKAIFTPQDLKQIFTSKEDTGTGFFSFAKVNELVKGIDTINKLKKTFEEELFKAEFGHLPIAGQIALLHIINPLNFPMFDPHIYRAHQFLKQGKIAELEDISKAEQFNAYIDYKSYIFALAGEKIVLRKIDKAMWAFGKFLNQESAKQFI